MNKITADDLEGLNHKQQVMFALFCAKQVEHLIESEKAKRCVEVTELWLDGKATADECREVADAANAANAAAYAGYATRAGDAARAAGYAAYTADDDWAADDAARGAGYAAYTAADKKEETLKQQHQYLYELKNIDNILEEELLT